MHCLSDVAVGAADSNVGSVPPIPPPPHFTASFWHARAEVEVGAAASKSVEVAHTGCAAQTLSACEAHPVTSYSPTAFTGSVEPTVSQVLHGVHPPVVLFLKCDCGKHSQTRSEVNVGADCSDSPLPATQSVTTPQTRSFSRVGGSSSYRFCVVHSCMLEPVQTLEGPH